MILGSTNKKYRYERKLTLFMQLSSEMIEAINEQISYEASSSNAYTAIGSWCERMGYDGSSAFFYEQAKEETTHMLKFIHYLNNAGSEAIIPAIDKPIGNFESLETTFEFGLESEQKVSKTIYELVDLASKQKDYSTYSFLQWFVTEQTEEEILFQTILQKFDLIGRDKLAVYQIDQSLSAIRSQVVNKQQLLGQQ